MENNNKMDSQTSESVENKNRQIDIEEEDDDDDDEEIYDAFTCCVCLDLLYKPIVLPCGHVSCFWCVHRSMNGLCESHCPICRQPYNHFPTICQLLHFLIVKIYPNAHRRRETQILEQEKRDDVFSPQINVCSKSSHSNQDVGHFESFNNSNLEQAESASQDQGSSIYRLTSEASSEPNSTALEVVLPSDKLNGICKKTSISDVLCSRCNQLLFHPVVLNCGHVYCKMCIIKPANEVLRCNVCQCPHPNGLPKVCLVLDQYLEEQFPEDYKQRKEAVKLKKLDTCNETQSARSSSAKASEEGSSRWNDPRSKIHIGVGCDFCGMCPITGDRYRCKDCKEKIGFDLCSDCYNTNSKLPGRFNQQHKPEHEFELIRSNYFHNIMLRLVTEQADVNSSRPDDSPLFFTVSSNATENSEFESSDLSLSEDAENYVNNVTADDSSENQTNERSE